MTDIEQQIVIAEFCGWYDCKCNEGGNVPYGKLNDDWNRDARDFKDFLEHIQELPDYLNDLNSIHDAVMILRSKDAKSYLKYTVELVRQDGWNYTDAPARLRCEALLKVIGKWK